MRECVVYHLARATRWVFIKTPFCYEHVFFFHVQGVIAVQYNQARELEEERLRVRGVSLCLQCASIMHLRSCHAAGSPPAL